MTLITRARSKLSEIYPKKSAETEGTSPLEINLKYLVYGTQKNKKSRPW